MYRINGFELTNALVKNRENAARLIGLDKSDCIKIHDNTWFRTILGTLLYEDFDNTVELDLSDMEIYDRSIDIKAKELIIKGEGIVDFMRSSVFCSKVHFNCCYAFADIIADLKLCLYIPSYDGIQVYILVAHTFSRYIKIYDEDTGKKLIEAYTDYKTIIIRTPKGIAVIKADKGYKFSISSEDMRKLGLELRSVCTKDYVNTVALKPSDDKFYPEERYEYATADDVYEEQLVYVG